MIHGTKVMLEFIEPRRNARGPERVAAADS